MTGRIFIDLFTTLDGVAQAPGGPDEDRSNGFPFGGWQAPLFDAAVGNSVGEHLADIDALVLGRRTYDIFAAYWPHQNDGQDSSIAHAFNRIPKYVASRTAPTLEWEGSTLLGSDIAAAFAALRARHNHIHVIGSVDFAQTLLAERLYDELRLWVYPIVLGEGKKVFPDGAVPARLHLIAPPTAGESGAVLLRYAPTGEAVLTGDMGADDRGR